MCFVVLWHVADRQRLLKAVRPTAPTATPLPAPVAPEIRSWSFQSEVSPASVQESQNNQPEPSPPVEASEPPEEFIFTEPQEAQAASVDTNWQELQNQLDDYIRGHGLSHVVGVVSSEHGLVISLSDTITLFPHADMLIIDWSRQTIQMNIEPRIAGWRFTFSIRCNRRINSTARERTLDPYSSAFH